MATVGVLDKHEELRPYWESQRPLEVICPSARPMSRSSMGFRAMRQRPFIFLPLSLEHTPLRGHFEGR